MESECWDCGVALSGLRRLIDDTHVMQSRSLYPGGRRCLCQSACPAGESGFHLGGERDAALGFGEVPLTFLVYIEGSSRVPSPLRLDVTNDISDFSASQLRPLTCDIPLTLITRGGTICASRITIPT